MFHIIFISFFIILFRFNRYKGHVAMRHVGDCPCVLCECFITLNVGRLDGDSGGMIHVGKSQRLIVNSAPSQFPVSFKVYEQGFFHVPPKMLLRNLYYPIITLEGTLSGLNELSIGKGTVLEVTEQVIISYHCFF